MTSIGRRTIRRRATVERSSPRKSPRPVLGRGDYLRAWSTLHSGIDPSKSILVSVWLRLMFAIGAPLARRGVSADVVTLVTVVVAGASLLLSRPGTYWPLLAAALIVVSGALDGVDGAVAVIGRAQSRWGYVLDTVADRCSDLMFLAGAAMLGAPLPVVVATGTLTLLHETARARAIAAGIEDVGFLTVWERPSRVVAAVVTATTVGAVPANATSSATIGACVTCAIAAVGFVQLMVGLYRRAKRSAPY